MYKLINRLEEWIQYNKLIHRYKLYASDIHTVTEFATPTTDELEEVLVFLTLKHGQPLLSSAAKEYLKLKYDIDIE